MNTNQLRHKLPRSQEWTRLKDFLEALERDGLIKGTVYPYTKGPIYRITQEGHGILNRLRELDEDPKWRHFLPSSS